MKSLGNSIKDLGNNSISIKMKSGGADNSMKINSIIGDNSMR